MLLGLSAAVDNTQAEIRLWMAVLERAMEDAKGRILTGGMPKSKKHQRAWQFNRHRIIESAHTWFRSHRQSIGSFLWICELLDLDPAPIRHEVTKIIPTYY